MIKGSIKAVEQEAHGVLVRIRVHYPNYPHDLPYRDECATQEEFENKMRAHEVKRGIYEKQKREIDLLRLGVVNLFQDEEVV